MSAQITHLPASTTQEELLHYMAEDGAVIIDDVLRSGQLQALEHDLAPFLKKEVYGRDAFTGFNTQRIGALIARSRACGELALEPRVLDAARTYLAEHCDDVQLHFTSAVAIAPGESAQILHRDRGIWGGYVPRQIEPLFSTIWALTPFTQENGATQVVIGSHRWEKKRQPEPNEIAFAEMSPGSVLCYNGTVLHGGGANVTENETRVGVFLHYTLSWLRQEENQYLSCPPKHAEHLSQELRALIGYAKGGYVLGFYSDPDDDSAQHESVSPENLFSQHRGDFDVLPAEEQLVSHSTRKI
ncbi:MAG: phytanoyl-CoA dioxygenase family protein [Pseudomonadota bacterium]|nr:phytanoyl-CoA dioxygenase family protein [Pseudomonadota bacterium]